METFVLILWITLVDGPHASSNGGISMQEFATRERCESALRVVTQGARNVAGVCMPTGKRSA